MFKKVLQKNKKSSKKVLDFFEKTKSKKRKNKW